MKMSYNLNLSQTQKLVMTPELKQAIEILQYNSVELNEFIRQELLSNPLLENPKNDETDDEKKVEESEPTEKESNNIDWKEYFSDFERTKIRNNFKEEKEEVLFQNFVTNETTLTEHLLFQLKFTLLDKAEKIVAEYIIENLDSNGYYQLTDDEIKEKFGIDDSELEKILDVIHDFDPLGVCARNLRECLLLQLERRRIEYPVAEQIISLHLDDLASNRILQIAKATNFSKEEIQEAADFIKTLEPKPGREFASMKGVKYIIPDIAVEKIEGEYVIKINDITAPRLTISNYYKKLLSSGNIENNASSYINEKLNAAVRIIKSIEQRRNTIARVVSSIIEFQYDFFENGKAYLKPLTLKNVAEQVEVHESTVSRAINGKYMQCPRGIFELKFFFQSGVLSNAGEGVSSASIQSMIKDIIERENPNKPHSDQFITEELINRGIKISRRTVAKYRDELKIPSSSRRKRY
ncbi:MAG: RNA polymerase factor sigma-54 [Peptostreptococcaceae bacterium]|nr:RNA polymerase factor sigma-54 [Peptostreptococcaceae bacterium]